QQALHAAAIERSDGGDIEGGERFPEGLPFAEDDEPAQPRLKALQGKLLEQAPVIGNRPAPLQVVITRIRGIPRGPPTAGNAVLSRSDAGLWTSHRDGRVASHYRLGPGGRRPALLPGQTVPPRR